MLRKWVGAVLALGWLVLPVIAEGPSAKDHLIAAVARGDADAVVRHLADPDTVRTELNPECPPRTRCKPITFAAELSDPTVLRLLLEAGADPNGTNSVGDNGLIIAIMSGNSAGIDVLLEFGADVNQPNTFGISPVLGVVMMGDAALLERLLQHGGDPNARTVSHDQGSRQSRAGVSLLCVAAKGGHVEAVRVLLEHGANRDVVGPAGQSAPDCVGQSAAPEILALLAGP